MQALICKNCGATLNPHTLKCEYCGTQYRRECGDGVIRVESYQRDVAVLRSRVSIEDFILRRSDIDKTAVLNATRKDLTYRIAEALEPYIDIETHYEPRTMTHTVIGTIRVLEPDFKF